MRLLTACLWAVLSLFSNQSSGQAELACSEMFKLADPRNCCSIPFLLSPDVLEPCLQIQLIPNSLEGENKCPKHYWTDTDKCKLLVRTLNECPYFLVYSDRY
uniref:Uncharacterized protein n=1 Tax=Anopheles maculatus TaxID=74869 RepID=A0A182SMG8_9DIPT